MWSLLLHTFTCICVLTGPLSAITTETVVGVAGRRVVLPCRLDVEPQKNGQVCWGRGQPSLFNCHNAVINVQGEQVTYRRSYRFSMSPSLSLSILSSRSSDSGFYHCRVQVPGLFNDKSSSVHLIIITAHTVDSNDSEDLNSPDTGTRTDWTGTAAGFTAGDQTADTGSGSTDTTQPMVALVQSAVQQQELNSLQTFVGNTLRLSFIAFIPALLLSSVYRLCSRGQTKVDRSQSEEEEEEEERHTCV